MWVYVASFILGVVASPVVMPFIIPVVNWVIVQWYVLQM
jgi:hypothetical protein